MPTSTTLRCAFCECASVAVAEMPAASARNTAAETDAGNGDSAASAFLTPWSAQKTSTDCGSATGFSVFCNLQSVIAQSSSTPSEPGGFASDASRASADVAIASQV